MHYFQTALLDGLAMARQVQADPGVIIGPIAAFFGFILDFAFNLVYSITPNNSLGFAIILLTLIAMSLMLPLGIKSQQSMTRMQKLNPEVAKIRAKYGNSKDPEISRKMNGEIQALYATHKVNPLGGCLPMIIQMPLFFALIYIMQQSFLYIGTLGDLYISLAEAVQQVPNYLDFMTPLALPFIPNGWQDNADRIGALVHGGMSYSAAVDYVSGNYINLTNTAHLARVLNRFQAENWEALFAYVPQAYAPAIEELLVYKDQIESFFGLPLLQNSGFRFPGVIVPILTVLATAASSWLSQLVNKPADEKAKTQATLMMVIMPLMMGFFTVTMPAGVGLYWIVSNLFRLVQQLIMNARQGIKFRLPFVGPREEPVVIDKI